MTESNTPPWIWHRNVLDHGHVRILNLSGPVRRPGATFDADDIDPALSARMSFNNGLKPRARELDIALCDYLLRNKHTTPFEMVECWIEMKMPIFVARQFVRHRTATINEVSGRYITLPEEWYIPKPEAVGVKAPKAKQGRLMTGNPEDAGTFCDFLDEHCKRGYRNYKEAIKAGIPNELARCFLSLNHYTHWLWKQDLHNIMGFLALRVDNHAQWEAQAYAEAIIGLLRNALPDSMDLFDKYRRIS